MGSGLGTRETTIYLMASISGLLHMVILGSVHNTH